MSRLIPVIWCRHGGLLFVFLLTGFVMCKAGPESWNHLILQCPIALALLNRLVREAMLSWVIPANCMGERCKLFWWKKKGLVFERCAMMAIFWVIWVERNKTICEIEFDSGIWASVSLEIRDWTFFCYFLKLECCCS
jgi:hypothetical protein